MKGDDRSLEVLVGRYLKSIYRFAYSYTKDEQKAEDVAQETFLKVWKNIKKYDKQKNFKAWIYTIAKNTALDYLKKKNAIAFSQFETMDGRNLFIENIKDTALLPDKIMERKNMKAILNNAVKKLSEKYREVLTLYYTEDLNFREIAEQLDESINTVKSRHRRGLVLLRATINNN